MYIQPYIAILKNLKGMLNFSSAIDISKLEALQKRTFEDDLLVTERDWNRYKKLIEWNKNVISPIFPYALLTHLQIKLTADPMFPSRPTGILHKREIIQQFKTLSLGKWHFSTRLKHFIPVKKGYEASIVTQLFIENILVWQSETLGLILSKSIQKSDGVKTDKAIFNVADFEKGTLIELKPSKAREYAWFSGNIDPIHFSAISAKMMGHPSSIMHGMWNAARIVSELEMDHFENTTFQFQFIAGFYLPGKANIYLKKEIDKVCFALHNSSMQKPFLIGEVVE